MTASEQKDWCEETQLSKMYTTENYYGPKDSKTFVSQLRKITIAEFFAANVNGNQRHQYSDWLAM